MIRYSENKPTHRFGIGQSVQMKTFGTGQPTGEKFTINALLPPRDGAPQYRLRGESEKHDRVIQEDNLILAAN